MPSMIIRRAFIAFISILFISILVGSLFAESINYLYDEMNRLKEVHYPDGTIMKYDYDKLGNITHRELVKGGFVTLTVQKAGSGTVTSSPAGINCGADCTEQYNPGQTVTLTAVPAPNSGFSFAGWSGGGCSGTGLCEVTMNMSKTITATFEAIPTIISTSPDSSASGVSMNSNVTVNFNTPVDPTTITDSTFGLYNSVNAMVPATIQCNSPYTSVTLTPNSPLTPSTSYYLKISGGASGVLGASGTPMTNTFSTSFTTNTAYTLTVVKSGTGSGTVTSIPAGISCASACASTFSVFELNTMVTLTATPDSGFIFSGWSGGGCGGTGACQVTMNSPTTITATFNPILTATTVSATQINLSWLDNTTNETGFAIERKIGAAGLYVPIALVGPNVTSYSSKGLFQNTNYYYRVRAYYTGGFFPYSNEANATTGIPSQVMYSQIAAGEYHTVALKSDGSLWAWGRNTYGQLGDGTWVSQSSPERIGTDNNWVSIAAGSEHTLALKSDGTLWAWGKNTYGQLGDGTRNILQTSPERIGTDNNWVSIAAGSEHTLALKSDGTLWAWGMNTYGQLGDGTRNILQTSPERIGTDNNWVSIAAGSEHTLALKSDGTLWAWGSNGSGQLGVGSDQLAPMPVKPDTRWSSISAGVMHSIALKSDGTLWAWGYPYYGQVTWFPEQIGTDTQWAAISAGETHTMSLKSDGTLWAWGYNGQVLTPTKVGTDNQWFAISAGWDGRTVALKADGTLWEWAGNTTPVQVSGDTYFTVKVITAGTGTVTSSPAGISCPAACSATFKQGSQITLKAAPNLAGSSFTGWSGGGCSGTGDCTITVNSTATVTATFDVVPVVTSITPADSEYNVSTWPAVVATFSTAMNPSTINSSTFKLNNVAGTITCNSPCTAATFVPSAQLLNFGYTVQILGGSSGVQDLSGKQMAATFYSHFSTVLNSNDQYTLIVTEQGDGAGTVTSNPAGVSCKPICSSAFNRVSPEMKVTLTAVPDSNSIFAGWSGGVCSGRGVCTITMDSNKTVTAAFNVITSEGTPSDLTATAVSPTQINLAWSDHSNKDIGFVVERKVGAAGVFVPIALVETNVTSYENKGLIQNTNYYYRVRAYNTGWYSPYSNEANATTLVPTSTILTQISAGVNHTVALRANGALWAWGDNEFGQLGDGTMDDKTSPIQIGADTPWVSIAAGGEHTVALKSDGTLWAWGQNSDGQLGNDTKESKTEPVKIGMDTNWVSIAAGGAHTVALKSDGSLWAWGYNDFGQVGEGTSLTRTSPVQIGSDTWVSIAAGEYHTVALKTDGTLWVWGYHGQTIHREPFQIGTDRWVSIAAGGYHTIARKSDGTLWAWGFNSDGQVGDGTRETRLSPVQIKLNSNGQISDGPGGTLPPPVQIGTDSQWASISGGGFHTVALKSDGSLWTWGYNDDGELGDGTTETRTSPVKIGSDTQWSSISAGGFHTVALKSDGSLWVWGDNDDGQLGDGTMELKTEPVIHNPIVIPSAGANGSISPAVPQTVTYGSIASFTVTPNTGYHIASVTGCGGALNGNTYTTGVIFADCTVSAIFAINTYTITAAAGSGGAITPASATVNYGAGQTFTITPNSGYHIVDVQVDGTSQGPITSYTFAAVTAIHTISASFSNIYPLTVAKTGAGSGIVTSTPAGINCGSTCSATFLQGLTVTFTAVPDPCMQFTGWSGGCTGTGTCTVTMTEAKLITATFSYVLPTPDFTATPLTGSAPFDVAFTDASTCATSLSWNFGDNDPNNTNTSSLQNPTHTYRKPGIYSVTLTATNPGGFSTITKNDLISAQPCPNFPAKTGNTYYQTIAEAVNAAANGNTILFHAVDLTGPISINKNLTLDGGYNCWYTTKTSGATAIQGNVMIETGVFTVNMDSIEVN